MAKEKFIDMVKRLQDDNQGKIILIRCGIFFCGIGKDAVILYVDNFIQEYFAKQFIVNSYACIKNRGTHKACLDVQKGMKHCQIILLIFI